uniref:Uncharacterized protein n=1 Tax=Brassica oleracea TaxID=3712 RepID=A0A3P6BEU2_BRAOL|nr:unnamed protein product [Brassica oleracea]
MFSNETVMGRSLGTRLILSLSILSRFRLFLESIQKLLGLVALS